ncbi:MAG: lytic murein transglycosylase B [Betaproteobacteria bacterium RBG_16_56_24]|nr:MAG: lytic murein transglycosylase B [Betaproteobacteria bacterium RBG_16_56_24]
MFKDICIIPLLAVSLSVHSAQAVSLPGIPEFIDEMVARHHFKRVELEKAFDRAQHLPVVIEAISRPATTKPWLEYRANFVNPERIRLGLKFWNKYRQALQSAEQKFGVPQEIILAVIGVETVYGQDAGTFRTLDALTTLAFDYPRRAGFFRNELENYLLLAREQQLDLLAIRGSYAGALGIPQFMPSSYRNHAVDFNGNNRIDLLREAKDAIGSVANYLKSYGWDAGMQNTGDPLSNEGVAQLKHPVAVRVQVRENNGIGETAATRTLAAWFAAGVVPGENIAQTETARLIDFTLAESKEFWLVFNNFEVIARYNNSDFYAMSVFQLAEALKAARKISLAK